MLPRLCSQGTMVNSPSPKGKAFLQGQLHSLGDGGGTIYLFLREQGAC